MARTPERRTQSSESTRRPGSPPSAPPSAGDDGWEEAGIWSETQSYSVGFSQIDPTTGEMVTRSVSSSRSWARPAPKVES